MSHPTSIYRLFVFLLFTAGASCMAFASDDNQVIQVALDPVIDTQQSPYNAVGLIAGKRTFASAVIIENPRLVLTTAPLSRNPTLGEYHWHNTWNGEANQHEQESAKLLRRVWIFTGQKGYAAHWHKRTAKMRPGFARLESYENVAPEDHVAKRAEQPYDLLGVKETPKCFVGYPEKRSKYPDSQSVSPHSRTMQEAGLSNVTLEPLEIYKKQTVMRVDITSNPNTPNRFLGCEGGPLFIQNSKGNWEVAGIFSKEIHAVQAGNSTLLFRILDDEIYNVLIKPAL